jgi:hypothetical protein
MVIAVTPPNPNLQLEEKTGRSVLKKQDLPGYAKDVP